ncbi:5-(carboxyamino)imidazole ribonucleotide mutase [candidate division CSSED10-310 bacterium]|uniref:N5-carboxyaminoimidazole ribonucleotide mutase n=1 Tax=candidate division CSSED10-310 bacterium TaxID=2855610 RepID=A0ABV6YZ41_UNCC1
MVKPIVSIIMGSDSDLPIMEEAAKILDSFEIPFALNIFSAHRSPEKLETHLQKMLTQGIQVIICGAGAAAHLAGAVASRVQIPVIGVPLAGSPFNGLDALLATVQMPGGIPVATVGVGKSGAVNAALLAIQILALGNPLYAEKLAHHRTQQKDKIDLKNESLRVKYSALFKNICFSD